MGRTRFNLRRQLEAALRMLHVAEIILRDGASRGTLTKLARRYGVHRGTITRDVAKLREVEFETWDSHELADRIHRAEQRLHRLWDLDAGRAVRLGRRDRCFDPRQPRGAKPYEPPRLPVENPLELKKPEGINYVAANAQSLVARLLNVPDGFQPEPSEHDIAVARLLGHPPPQANKGTSQSPDSPANPSSAVAKKPTSFDREALRNKCCWDEYHSNRSLGRGLTAFEDRPLPDEW
jgi:hypothetical protein